MRVRRAILYTPGSEWAKIQKSAGLKVDSICLDLEDGTSVNKKAEARQIVVRALTELDFGTSERLVRINRVGSGYEEEDLNAILPCRPDGIVLPKAQSGVQIAWLDERVSAYERGNGWEDGSIRLIAVVESALGLLNLREIASHPRLDAIIFGAEDYTASIGAKRSGGMQEILWARGSVVVHAAAFEKQAIDMVSINFRDPVLLKIESASGAMLGFSGKQIIHPSQVEIVQTAFTPSDEEIAEAIALITAFEKNNANGFGAFEFDEKMVDMPLVKQAEVILAKAKAAGKIQ